ncbi:MAG: hypothetical protein AAF514_13265, partial [Verrucomicrobiota bacterium]
AAVGLTGRRPGELFFRLKPPSPEPPSGFETHRCLHHGSDENCFRFIPWPSWNQGDLVPFEEPQDPMVPLQRATLPNRSEVWWDPNLLLLHLRNPTRSDIEVSVSLRPGADGVLAAWATTGESVGPPAFFHHSEPTTAAALQAHLVEILQ